jgi:hypothetical protein
LWSTLVNLLRVGLRRGSQYFVGDGESRPHLENIMHADHMDAGEHRCRDRGGRGELGFPSSGLSKESLARGTNENRIFELREFGQAGNDLGVLFLALPETDTGIDDNLETIDAGPAGAAD